MNIHIVMGTCGEYSDRDEWAVIAYYSETKAQEHVVNAERRADELYAAKEARLDTEDWDTPSGKNEFDPNMREGWSRTTYFIHTVPIGDELLFRENVPLIESVGRKT